MKNFSGRIVYLVGGSSGIGLAVAKRLAARGAHLMIFARNKDRLEAARAEISQEAPDSRQRVSCASMDVSDPEQARAVLSAALAEFGVPDVLINAAGRALPRYFEDVGLDQLRETLEVNLLGIWHAVQVLAPAMKAKGGLIVNVSSMAGLIGVFGYTDYCASKFAIIGLSEALRSELKPHRVRVLVLCPADTDTPGFQVENKTKPAETRAISGQAVLQPDEVARALIRGMEKERFIIIPGLGNRVVFFVKRLCPGLVFHFMDRTIRRVQGRHRPVP